MGFQTTYHKMTKQNKKYGRLNLFTGETYVTLAPVFELTNAVFQTVR